MSRSTSSSENGLGASSAGSASCIRSLAGRDLVEVGTSPQRGARGVEQVDGAAVGDHVVEQAAHEVDELLEATAVVAAHPRQHRVVVEALGGDARHQLAVFRRGQSHVAHARTVGQTPRHAHQRVADPDHPRRQPAAAGRRWRRCTGSAAAARRSTPTSCGPPSRRRPRRRSPTRSTAGIDIGNDGEQARESFVTYVQHRMTGFGDTSQRPLMRDLAEHPDFMELALPRFQRIKVSLMAAPAAIAEVTYRDTTEVDAECALVADAPFAQTFMTACSPGIVASAMQNRHYATQEEYVHAVAAALSTEYRAIVERGLLLQIDAPDLAMERHTLFWDRPLSEFLAWVELVVDAINGALDGIDPANVRLHVCWGNYEGPHTHDVPFEEIQPLLYEANVGALVISMANARHAHEVRCFERRPLPDGMALVAGVIDTTSNYVEHPEVVADRIERAAGRWATRAAIIAGTDCGFDTTAGIGDVAPEPRVGEAARPARRRRPGVGTTALSG